MAEHGRGSVSPGFLPPPHPGDANRTQLKLAPSGLPRQPLASVKVSAPGLFRRNLPAGREPSPLVSTMQLLSEPDLQPPWRGVCLSPSALGQGVAARPSRRFPHLGPAQEYPTEQAGNRWLCLPSATLHPNDCASSRGDFPLARWGFLPRGTVWISAPLEPEGGAQPALCLPPNICILALAMMIAGIPTVPVPGVREEDMILAAQNFMAGSPQPGTVEGEAALQRRWAAVPRLGLSSKTDKQQQQRKRRGAGRNLLPLFLAQLEK